MDIAEIVRLFGQTIGTTATVKSVFGEPVTSGQRVVLPVAQIRCSFGGGGGAGSRGEGEQPRKGGGGGGGVIVAKPCGVVEVTADGARFVYYRETALLAAAAAAGFLLGLVLGSCRRGSKPV